MSIRSPLILLIILSSFIVADSISEIDANLKLLATANNELTLKLYERLTNGTATNVFISPLSLSICFGMLLHGTSGNTERELSNTLGYNNVQLNKDQISKSFSQLLSGMLSSRNNQCGNNYKLIIMNKILVQEGLSLLPSYKRSISSLYRASIEEVNFRRDPHTILSNINNWVRENTNGKINSILEEIKPNTMMTFLNAVYFKSAWKIPFSRLKTKRKKFYNDGSQTNTKRVPFMHTKTKFPLATFPDAQALELPYSGSCFSMIILLPTQLNGLSRSFNLLKSTNISSIRRQMHRTTVIVAIPKFKLRYSKEISPELRELGIQAIFNPKLADFSRMIASKNASISQIMHKAAIEVNEEGSEAAAVTGMNMIPVRMPMLEPQPSEFIADHPFMFLIIDKRNDMILFVGHVSKM